MSPKIVRESCQNLVVKKIIFLFLHDHIKFILNNMPWYVELINSCCCSHE